jgi:hypothetical protein
MFDILSNINHQNICIFDLFKALSIVSNETFLEVSGLTKNQFLNLASYINTGKENKQRTKK